jgi:hypothetical protein
MIDRLRALRHDALQMLAEDSTLDTGLMALVAHASAVLAVLDAEPVDAPLGARCVVSDDGTVIKLTVYDGSKALAVVKLPRAAALVVAADLVSAASRRKFVG